MIGGEVYNFSSFFIKNIITIWQMLLIILFVSYRENKIFNLILRFYFTSFNTSFVTRPFGTQTDEALIMFQQVNLRNFVYGLIFYFLYILIFSNSGNIKIKIIWMTWNNNLIFFGETLYKSAALFEHCVWVCRAFLLNLRK